MRNVSAIATIALASSLVLLVSGCDRGPEERTAGEAMDESAATERTETEQLGDTLQRDADQAGDTMEQRADQAGQAIEDATITAEIKTRFLADDTLKGLEINVDTEQGVVTLSGSVQSETAKDRATQIAQSVDDVVNVNNQLTVQ